MTLRIGVTPCDTLKVFIVFQAFILANPVMLDTMIEARSGRVRLAVFYTMAVFIEFNTFFDTNTILAFHAFP